MKMLKGVVIDICTFMNTVEEWHSFVIGLCEGFCFWKPRIEPRKLAYLQGEWHYYVFGRAIGFLALVWLIVAVIKAVF